MNTVYSIHNLRYQLHWITNLVKKDMNSNIYIYNYCTSETNVKLLDYAELEDYLVTADIRNDFILREICEFCTQIIDFWNEDFIESNEEVKVYSYENDKFFLNATLPFYCLYVKKNELKVFSSKRQMDSFFDRVDNYTFITIKNIADRCNIIRNIITKNFQNIHRDLYPLSFSKINNNTEEIRMQYNSVDDISNSNVSHIFKDKGFEMFKYYKEHYVTENRGKNADVAFIYRKLYESNYIHAKMMPFLEWFNSTYEESIDKLKTLSEVQNENRNRYYSSLLEVFR